MSARPAAMAASPIAIAENDLRPAAKRRAAAGCGIARPQFPPAPKPGVVRPGGMAVRGVGRLPLRLRCLAQPQPQRALDNVFTPAQRRALFLTAQAFKLDGDIVLRRTVFAGGAADVRSNGSSSPVVAIEKDRASGCVGLTKDGPARSSERRHAGDDAGMDTTNARLQCDSHDLG